MPLYSFENPESGELVEVFQHMNDPHVYKRDGVKWRRVFSVPQLATEGLGVDAFSEKKFLDKTNKTTTIGDMVDRAKELSAKRAEKNGGIDPIQEKAVKEHHKKHGTRHPSEVKKLSF